MVYWNYFLRNIRHTILLDWKINLVKQLEKECLPPLNLPNVPLASPGLDPTLKHPLGSTCLRCYVGVSQTQNQFSIMKLPFCPGGCLPEREAHSSAMAMNSLLQGNSTICFKLVFVWVELANQLITHCLKSSNFNSFQSLLIDQ